MIEDIGDLIGDLINKDIQNLNTHLPKRKSKLQDLLKVDIPVIEARDGSKIFLSKDELIDISKNLPDPIIENLNLPFIFIRRLDLGEGCYIIFGSDIEVEAYRLLLNLQYPIPSTSKSEYYTYKPFISELINRYGTLVQLGFDDNPRSNLDSI